MYSLFFAIRHFTVPNYKRAVYQERFLSETHTGRLFHGSKFFLQDNFTLCLTGYLGSLRFRGVVHIIRAPHRVVFLTKDVLENAESCLAVKWVALVFVKMPTESQQCHYLGKLQASLTLRPNCLSRMSSRCQMIYFHKLVPPPDRQENSKVH